MTVEQSGDATVPQVPARVRALGAAEIALVGRSGLLRQERETLGRERRGIVSSAIGRLPQAIVLWRFDRTQNELCDSRGALLTSRDASPRNRTLPDDNV